MKCFSESYLTEDVYLKYRRDTRELCSGIAGCIFCKAEPSGTGVAPQPCTCHLNTATATSRKHCLLASYPLIYGKRKILTLAAHPALPRFCPAASTTKHLLNLPVHCFKPVPREPKNLLQTPVPKPRGLDLHLGFAHKHPNSSECQVHGSTRYFLSSPLPRVTWESSAIAPSTGHSLKANF